MIAWLRNNAARVIVAALAACMCAPASAAPASAAPASTAPASDVTVELLQLGVGNHVRPGNCTGLLVRLTSNLTEPVNTRVQWELRNADGDTALYAREVPLAPGAPVERWLYGVVPITSASADSALDMVTVVRVLQIEDGRVTRELAVERLDGAKAAEQPMAVQVTTGLIGVIGDGRAGLATLGPAGASSGGSDNVNSMNEAWAVARGIQAATLPDRWEGLASYTSMVWGNGATQNLGPEQAQALTDWVRRGGNLIILLSESGDPWGLLAGNGGRTPLADVLPTGGMRRNDGVLVRDLLPLIARTRDLRNPTARTTLWTFDASAVGRGYEPIMAMPCPRDERTGNLSPTPDTLQGQVVAVRRTLGFGAITLVGIDADGLERRALNPEEGLPQADVFWNRLLGLRADTPSPRTWNQIENDKRSLPSQLSTNFDIEGGTLFGGAIGMRGAAAIGVLALIVSFGVYWVIAGPGTFFVLRSMKKAQYAWFAFVVVSGVATILTWMATGLSELASGRVQHVTYLERVDSPTASPQDRAMVNARMWFSAQLPGYGPTQVSLTKDSAAPGSDAIWTWFPPPAGRTESFPDTERYLVHSNVPADYNMPSRATSTELWGEWMGDPSPEWANLPAVVEGSQLRQDLLWDNGSVPKVILHGVLQHNLPAALEDVLLIHINPVRVPARRPMAGDSLMLDNSGSMPNYGRLMKLNSWDRNQPLDVGASLYGRSGAAGARQMEPVPGNDQHLNDTLRLTYVKPIIDQTMVMRTMPAGAQFTVLNFFNMLPPPTYVLSQANAAKNYGYGAEIQSVQFHRDTGRGVDLSLWFTRPCLIVIGTVRDRTLDGISAPFPIEIAGDAPQAEGDTIVRVVFPLPDPPALIAPRMPSP